MSKTRNISMAAFFALLFCFALLIQTNETYARTSLSQLQAQITALQAQVNALEGQVDADVSDLQAQIDALQTQVDALKAQVASGVPKTGQTTSYATGDDGDLQKGVEWPVPRFTDNGDGTVTDNLTGLIWLQNADCFNRRNWSQAFTAANTLNSGECGLNDGSGEGAWRLPNVKELQSLIDFGALNLALPSGHLFFGVQSSDYWSSTTIAYSTSRAWYVNMRHGTVDDGDKANGTYFVWPVRGGQ